MMVPLLFALIAYAVDFGYFFIAASNITSAARNAAQYSVMGYQSADQGPIPTAGPGSNGVSVAEEALGDLTSLINSSTTATVEVCSKNLGTTGNLANCANYGPSAPAFTPNADPEAPRFVLQRVDITYTVQPPIPMKFFKVSLLSNDGFSQASLYAGDRLMEPTISNFAGRFRDWFGAISVLIADDGGSVAIETTVAYMVMTTCVLGILGFTLMVYTYCVYQEAARSGVRYAIVHGSDSSNCSGPTTGCGDQNATNVVNAVMNFASPYTAPIANATVSVSYPDATGCKPPSMVIVTVTYTYAALFNPLPNGLAFTTTSQGRIVY